MRTYILTLVLLFGCTVMAQQDAPKTVVEKEGKLTKVSVYHDNGQLAQEGFLKNNRLHGKWMKYDAEGKLLCVANYTKGERNGTWLFWDNNDLIEVEFKNNAIVQKISWEASNRLVDAQK